MTHAARCRPVEPLEPRRLFAVAGTDVTFRFAEAINVAAGADPVALAPSDFNADGHADLAVADGAGFVRVLFGDGTGNMTAGPVLPVAGVPTAIVTGDFTGDGLPDIAVADRPTVDGGAATVTVFPGLAHGTFAAGIVTTAIRSTPAADPLDMVAADVNGDGRLDLVLTDYADEAIVALLGNGNATFAAPVVTSTATVPGSTVAMHPSTITTADINADGHADLVVGGAYLSTAFSNDTGAVTFIGDGTGRFADKGDVGFGGSDDARPTPVLLADLSGDGRPDLTVASYATSTGAGFVTLRNNDGTGTFDGGLSGGGVTIAGGVSAVSAGDYDLDGVQDVAAAHATDAAVDVTQGLSATREGATDTVLVGGVPADVITADVNGDGRPDLLTANPVAGTISVVLDTATVTPIATAPTVSATTARAAVGGAVTVTAAVHPADTSPIAGEASPTGTFSFYDGKALLGTAPIVGPAATFTTTALRAGAHAITARYSGDLAYAAGTTAAATTVTVTKKAPAGNLTAAIVSTNLPTTAVPGETGTITVQLTNSGKAAVTGKVTDALYLSPDGLVDASAIAVPLTGKLAAVKLGTLRRGRSIDLTGTFAVPNALAVGTYTLLVKANANGAVAESDSGDDTAAAAAPTAVELAFGTVGGRAGVSFLATDPFGSTATLALAGPGTAAVTSGLYGQTITLTGTTADTTLTITPVKAGPSGGAFELAGLDDDAMLGAITAPDIIMAGVMDLDAGAGMVHFLQLAGGGQIINGYPYNSPDTAATFGSGPAPTIVADVINATITADAGIESLDVNSWQGTTTAGWIASLMVHTVNDVALTLTGDGAPNGLTLGSAEVDGSTALDQYGADWTITGTVGQLTTGPASTGGLFDIAGTVNNVAARGNFTGALTATTLASATVAGNLTGSLDATANITAATVDGSIVGGSVVAGAPVDRTLGGPGELVSLTVHGSLVGAVVGAGLTVYNNAPNPLTLVRYSLSTGGSIGSIVVDGTVNAATYVLAASGPATYTVGGKPATPGPGI